ncbi:MAG: hypothetical protein KF825_09985 [Ferruginibacter sp.]|nr:hypothetical protein [Ferruginibacter sp.]
MKFEVSQYSSSQRTGIADGGEFYIRPPEPLPGFLIKLNIKNKSWALFVEPRTAVQQNYRC